MDRLLTVFDAATGPFERGVSRVERSIGRFERGVDKRLRNFDRRWEQSARSIRMLERTVVAVGSGAAINAMRRYAEGWRQVQRALAAAGFEGEAAEKSLVGLAMRTRSSVDQAALATKRISRATGDGLEATIRRVETIQKLLAVGGATQTQREAVLQQLPQALQAGALQGDEFRSLRENAPVELLHALAKSAGVGIEALKDVASQGKLTTKVVTDAVDSLADAADRKFSKLAQTGDEAFTVLNNGLKLFVGRIDSKLGATKAFNDIISEIGHFLKDASGEAKAFAEALQYVAIVGTSIATGLASASVVNSYTRAAASRSLLVATMEAENVAAAHNLALASAEIATKGASAAASETLTGAQLRAATASNALAAAQTRVSIAGRAAAASTAALTRVLAFFGGPVGLAVTAAAAGMLLFGIRAREAAQEAERSGQNVISTLEEIQDNERELAQVTADLGETQSEASRTHLEGLKKENEALRKKLSLQRESLVVSEMADRVALLERKILTAGLAERRLQESGLANETVLAQLRENRESLLSEREKLLQEYWAKEAELAAKDADKATELDEITVTGGGSGSGRGKADKPPELQGPEYDPGALFRDQLTEARELIEENRTAEEKLARAKARILALQPALVEAIRAEAFAHGEVITAADAEVKAKAVIERANESLVDSAESVEKAQREALQEFARGLASTIRQADSLSDALDKIADQLLDMVLDDAFSTLFGGKSSSPLNSIFGFLSSGIGSLFGGGAGGFTGLGVYADGGMVRGPGTGRSDSITARLSNGEFVVNARATARNRGLLEAINGGRPLRAFADGGLVTPSAAPVMAPPPRINSVGAKVSITNSVSVTVDGGDDPQQSGQAAAAAVRTAVNAEMQRALRPGGVLDNALKGKR